MGSKFNRNIILHVNKFQSQIIYPVLVACAFASILIIFCFIFILAKITNAVSIGPFNITDLQMFMPWILILVAYIIIFIVFWTYYTTNKILGPYNRVIKELDDVIAGKRKEPIGTRKGDVMFEQLLKRINQLITKINQP